MVAVYRISQINLFQSFIIFIFIQSRKIHHIDLQTYFRLIAAGSIHIFCFLNQCCTEFLHRVICFFITSACIGRQLHILKFHHFYIYNRILINQGTIHPGFLALQRISIERHRNDPGDDILSIDIFSNCLQVSSISNLQAAIRTRPLIDLNLVVIIEDFSSPSIDKRLIYFPINSFNQIFTDIICRG